MKILEHIKKDKTILIAISIGIAYFWFGILKFFPTLSPAEDLAKETISKITFHAIPDSVSIIILAVWETIIGVFLLLNQRKRFIIYAALIHMVFTFAPLIIMSDTCFQKHFYSPSLVGQYIIKNLIITSALLVLLPSRKKEQID